MKRKNLTSQHLTEASRPAACGVSYLHLTWIRADGGSLM